MNCLRPKFGQSRTLTGGERRTDPNTLTSSEGIQLNTLTLSKGNQPEQRDSLKSRPNGRPLLQFSQSRPPASSGLAHLPGSHGDALPGPFSSRLPLAGTGPSLAAFLAGWGQKARECWPRPADLAGDLIGAACVLAMPFLFLFGAFLK